MTSSPNKLRVFELAVYLFLWLAFFMIPVFAQSKYGEIAWPFVMHDWLRMMPYIIVFFLNNYILVDFFLFKKKYLKYVLSLLMLMMLLFGYRHLERKYIFIDTPIVMPEFSKLDANFLEQTSKDNAEFSEDGCPPANERRHDGLGCKRERPFDKMLMDNFIIVLLVIGFGVAIKFLLRWRDDEERRMEFERNHLQAELSLLRHQIAPHFLMNTLNNIHALVDIDTERSKTSIIRLSNLLRYLLYESGNDYPLLKKELEFIESFLDLMKLRFNKNIKIDVNIPAEVPHVRIAPMLFITFIENACKHGVSYQKPSFISIKIELEGEYVHLNVKNSNHANKTDHPDKHSGIGLQNVKKSLQLLFGDNYHLQITDTDIYEVDLKIPTHGN